MRDTNESSADKAKRLARRAASRVFHRGAIRRSMKYRLPEPLRNILKQKGLTAEQIDAAIKEGEQGDRNDRV